MRRPLKPLAGNEVIETLGFQGDEGIPHITHHDRQVQDQRAKLVFDFLRSWGYAAAMGDMMSCGGEKTQRPAPTDLAIRACEIVDAAWSELRHRGWIVEQPPYEDCV